MSEEKNKPAATGSHIRPYQRPRLISYGKFVSVTTGGTAHANEAERGNAKNRP